MTDLITPVRDLERSTLQRQDFPHIALCGRMGAGKTTAANYLVERFGYQRIGFADAVRDVAARVYGEAARQDRQKLIDIGMGMREIDPDIWVKAHQTQFEIVQSMGHTPVVVDDLRFPNEWWALKEGDFVIARVAAERLYRVNRLKASGKWQNEEQLENPSETALDGYVGDHILFNQGTRDVLQNAVVEMLYQEAAKR